MDIVTVLTHSALVAMAATAFIPPVDAQSSLFACRLSALTPEERAQQQELRARIERGTTRITEDAEGYTFHYAVDVSPATVIAWVENERKCCPFLRFTLDLPEEGKPSRLRVWGAPGVQAFLATELRAKVG